MNKFLRLPTLLIWLTSLWVALWADLTVGNVLGGLIGGARRRRRGAADRGDRA